MAKDSQPISIELGRMLTISPDVEAFDSVIRANGIEVIHYVGVRCPIGLMDRYDTRQSHAEHDTCSNGFIYKKAGLVTIGFLNNSLKNQPMDIGSVDFGEATAIFPRVYDDNQEKLIYLSPYDRIFLNDSDAARVTNWQLVEANQTGTDRLLYPPVSVEYIIDANGEEYSNKDYVIDGGTIKWTGQHRPGYNPTIGKGVIYSIRYNYIPYWYIKYIKNEIRVAKTEDYLSGERKTTRMPYQVVLQREISFENENNESDIPGSLRDAQKPRSGGFGPR